jgi:predicted DNA-binding transcriptional regulator AlpA
VSGPIFAPARPSNMERMGDVVSTPQKLHLDKRAAAIAATVDADNADELLTTPATAAWLGVSTAWLENARHRGYGPPYERLGPRTIRYLRSRVRYWLDERSHRSTSEYRP